MHTFKKQYRSQNYAYLRNEVTKYDKNKDSGYNGKDDTPDTKKEESATSA